MGTENPDKLHAMSKVIDDLAAKFLEVCGKSGESEQRVIERLTKRLHISHNTAREFEESLTFGQRLADRIAIFGGSWTFILLFLAALLAWIVLNTLSGPNCSKCSRSRSDC
jgi:uncharacterized membrane protein